MLPFNKPLPDEHIKWVQDLLAALPVLPGQPPPPPIDFQPACTFLTLPAELRLQIYESCQEVKQVITLDHSPPFGFNHSASGLLTMAKACRQTRYELLPILWKKMTLQVDDVTMLALRGNHGIFTPENVTSISLAEKMDLGRKPLGENTIVQSLRFALATFPNIKKVVLRQRMKVSLLEQQTNPVDEITYKNEALRDLRSDSSTFLQRVRGNNDFLDVLASRVCRVAMMDPAHQHLHIILTVQLRVKIRRTPHQRINQSQLFVFGDVDLDFRRREMVWKYQDEEYKLGDILTDLADVYEDWMKVGGARTRVYIA